jgi:hypothetical protein
MSGDWHEVTPFRLPGLLARSVGGRFPTSPLSQADRILVARIEWQRAERAAYVHHRALYQAENALVTGDSLLTAYVLYQTARMEAREAWTALLDAKAAIHS